MTDTPSAADALKPCPFCGSNDIDPEGWMSLTATGPACNNCSASANSIPEWQTRAAAPQEADDMQHDKIKRQTLKYAAALLNQCETPEQALRIIERNIKNLSNDIEQEYTQRNLIGKQG